MTDDALIAFLTARLGEAERGAEGLLFAARIPGKMPDFTACGGPAAETYWRQQDPAATLRDVRGKRQIVEMFDEARQLDTGSQGVATLRMVARSFAEVYAGHPGYKSARKP